jgi:hypothetical protein
MVRLGLGRGLGPRVLSAVALGNKAALVTSPGFGRAFAANLTVLIVIAGVASRVPLVHSAAVRCVAALQLGALSTAHKYAWWGAISLLSSSCCALQVNALMPAR